MSSTFHISSIWDFSKRITLSQHPLLLSTGIVLIATSECTRMILEDISIFDPSTLYKTRWWYAVSRTSNEFSIVLYEPGITIVRSGYVTAYIVTWLTLSWLVRYVVYNCCHLRSKLRLSIDGRRISIIPHVAKFRMLRSCKMHSYRSLRCSKSIVLLLKSCSWNQETHAHTSSPSRKWVLFFIFICILSLYYYSSRSLYRFQYSFRLRILSLI